MPSHSMPVVADCSFNGVPHNVDEASVWAKLMYSFRYPRGQRQMCIIDTRLSYNGRGAGCPKQTKVRLLISPIALRPGSGPKKLQLLRMHEMARFLGGTH